MLGFFKRLFYKPINKVSPIILVVAENRNTQETLRKDFEALHCIINSEVSGKNALKYMEAGPVPDLIILDLVISEIDGRDLYRLFRMHKIYSAIPVIPLPFELSHKKERGVRILEEIPTSPIEINTTPATLLYSVALSLRKNKVALPQAYQEKIQNLNRSWTTSIKENPKTEA